MDSLNDLKTAVYEAGTVSSSSAIIFEEDDEHAYCPFCGKALKSSYNDLGVLITECDCSGFKEEQEALETIVSLTQEMESIKLRISNIRSGIRRNLQEKNSYELAKKIYINLINEKIKKLESIKDEVYLSLKNNTDI